MHARLPRKWIIVRGHRHDAQMTGPDNPQIDPGTKASNPLQEMNRIAAARRNLFCRAAFGKCVKECLA